MSLSKVTLTDDFWVGVPSRQCRRHWEVVRRLVLERTTDDVLAVTRRIRACQRTNGWRPCRAMEVAGAEQDVYEIIYLLVDQEVYTDMLLWALDWAATGSVACPVRQQTQWRDNAGRSSVPPGAGDREGVYEGSRVAGGRRRHELLLG
jgi:hypothetical protein